MAQLNQVADLVETRALFEPKDLITFSNNRSLLICDAEGLEATLFSADSLKYTQNWDMIIELHGDSILRLPLLQWPHKTTVINQQSRDGHYPELAGIGTAQTLLSEYRSDASQCWLWCDAVPAPSITQLSGGMVKTAQ
jgi:hypothetical protein